MADGCKCDSRVVVGSAQSAQFLSSLTRIEDNETRAMRLAEIMKDFRDLQQCLSDIKAAPAPSEANWLGFRLLRKCSADGLSILRAGFPTTQTSPEGDLEAEREQLGL